MMISPRKKTVEVIELTRNVCDLKSFAEQLDEQGSVLFGTLSEDFFSKSAKQITQSIKEVLDDILKQNYRQFLTILEKHSKTKARNQYDSKDFIKDLLNSYLKLFKGVELTMHIICASAVKVSVESDVESLVSRYEKHFKIDRQLDEH